MFDTLKTYCKNAVLLTDEELSLIDIYFEVKILKKYKKKAFYKIWSCKTLFYALNLAFILFLSVLSDNFS